MLPEDRLACIAPTDGTLGGKAPALFGSTTMPLSVVQPVEDSNGKSSQILRVSLFRARSSTAGGPGWATGSRPPSNREESHGSCSGKQTATHRPLEP